MSAINFGTGFTQGFNTADRAARGRRALDLQEDRLEEAQKRSDQRQQLAVEGLELQREQAESQDNYRTQSLAIQQGRAEADAKWRENQMGRQDAADAAAASEREQARLRELAQAEMIKVTNGGQPDPQVQARIAEAGLPHLTVDFWLQDENVKKNLAGQQLLNDLQQSGDFSAVNRPETLGLLNDIYRDQIEKGIGEVSLTSGKRIVDKRLSGFMLSPGHSTPEGSQGVVTKVRVVYEDGTSEEQPITLGRSSDRNDPVAINDVGTMLDDLTGRVKMAEVFSNKEFRQSIAHLLPSASADGKNSTTDIKNIQFLTSNGMTFEDAKNTIFMAKNNPNQAISTLAGDILDNNLFAEEGQKLSPEQAYEKAHDIVMSNLVGPGGGSGNGPQGGSAPQGNAAQGQWSEDQIQKVLAANKGKDRAWAVDYLNYLKENGKI